MSTTPDTDTPELIERTWTYTGAEIVQGGKLGSAWLDHTGERRLFSDAPSPAIVGGIYTVRTTEDGTRAAVAGASYERASEDERTEEWRLTDRAERTEHGAIKAKAKLIREAKAEAGDLGSLTLAEVKAKMRGLPEHRAAVLATVLRYLG